MTEKKLRFITIGGGTGQFHVLRALVDMKKRRDIDITAIPTTIDSGGSSGILRLHYDIVAPGDISQCIYGLHPDPQKAAWLFDHRFSGNHGLGGHSVRNLIVAAALQQFGPHQESLDAISDTFGLLGRITPVTFSSSQLHAYLKNGEHLESEEVIYETDLVSAGGIDKLWLAPNSVPNATALEAIKKADVIIVCPGTLACSIIPNFLVDEVAPALIASKARKIYVSNLMNRKGHVETNWTVLDHVRYLEQYLNEGFFQIVIANTQKLTPEQELLYRDEKTVVASLSDSDQSERMIIGVPLLVSLRKVGDSSADRLAHLRASVRHDSTRLARTLEMLMM